MMTEDMHREALFVEKVIRFLSKHNIKHSVDEQTHTINIEDENVNPLLLAEVFDSLYNNLFIHNESTKVH